MEQWTVPAWVILVAGVATLLLLLQTLLGGRARRREQARLQRALDRQTDEAEQLRVQVAEIERRMAPGTAPTDSPPDYLITRLGSDPEQPADQEPQRVDTVPGPLFADLVLRESVVQGATMFAGLRRALSTEVRHRIRFEMRREVKRARKQRKSDTSTARREWQARQRADIQLEQDVDGSAA